MQCVAVATRLCEIRVQHANSLAGLVRHVHLDINWRRMWSLHSHLTNPYQVIEDRTLRLGAVYSVRDGDTLITLAARFETTVKRLLHVNPHVLDAGDFWAGVDLCILPCTTRKPPQPPSYAGFAFQR